MGINYERLYAYRFRGVAQAARQAVWDEIADYVYRRLDRPTRVLDAAGGRGEFINAVPAQERWLVDAVDMGGLNPGINAVYADILEADLPKEYFDGVFVSNFLEHLPSQDVVAEVLEKLASTMRPGGSIAVIGPNFRYSANEYFDCADHTLALTHVAVEEHLFAAGFEIEAVVARFLPYSFRGVLPPSTRLTRTYLRHPLLWRLLGKQFLLLARRPNGLLSAE